MRRKEADSLDPVPFRAWMESWLDANEHNLTALAQLLGLSARRLHRWRRESVCLSRTEVEDAFHLAGIDLGEVYPEYDLSHIVLEPERYCPKCRETTTPIHGICPWCETDVASGPPAVGDRTVAANG